MHDVKFFSEFTNHEVGFFSNFFVTQNQTICGQIDALRGAYRVQLVFITVL